MRNGVEFDIAVDHNRWFDPIRSGALFEEPWVLDFFNPLFDLMRPGDRVRDLGGHIGAFSLAAAALGCEVVCVEAAPENVALLNASVVRKGFERTRVVHAAATDHADTLTFLPNGPWGVIANPATLASPGLIGAAAHAPVVVPAVTVDALLDELGWDRVDFLKMDIEGAEIAAIRGMSRLLDRRDDLILFYESNAYALALFNATTSDLVAALARFGLGSYVVGPDRLVHAQPGDFQPKRVANYLAAKGRHERLRSWPISARRPTEDVIACVPKECGAAEWSNRAYVAGALRDAPAAVSADARVGAALAALRCDPDQRVRSAAAW